LKKIEDRREKTDKGKQIKENAVFDLLRVICSAVLDKKAERVKVINVGPLIKITDFFVLCSAESTTQVSAITEELLRIADKKGYKIMGTEGTENNLWVLVDFGDVVVHIFHEPVRTFYDLDGLWKDAEEINLDNLLKQKQIMLSKKQ
jgi:ribosome-associated protein